MTVDGKATDVATVDDLCPHRPCFRLGFDKGPFTQGIGYTSYYPKPFPVCMTRHLHGCPHVGVHLTCGDCQWQGHPTLEGCWRVKLAACPRCGSGDLYWLADMLPPPAPCCAAPDLPAPRKGTRPYRQRCRACGTTLAGARLEQVRDTLA